ncbi:MAG: hypothetical protein IIA64_06905, partial [Planctomycetes bacterium]|nr:hypothetical protein [Planctomycetota bacterium]
VEVDLGQAEGLAVHLLGEFAGSFLQLAANGEFNGKPDQDLGHIRMPMLPKGGYLIDPNFSPIGVTEYNIEVYRAGELVHTQVQSGLAAIVPQLPHGLSVFLDQAKGGAAGGQTAHCVMWDLHFAIATDIQISDGPLVIGDLLRLAALPPDPNIVGFIDGLYITAADSGQLTLTIGGEGLLQFSNPHEALLQTRFDAMGVCPDCTLKITNIGDGGDYGVSIDLRNLLFPPGLCQPPVPIIPAVGVHLSIPDTPAGGAFLEVSAEGFNDEPCPIPVGSSRATNVVNLGMHVELTVDFLPIGAETYTGQIYNMGELVAEVMGLSGPVAVNEADLNLSAIGHVGAHADNFGFSSPSFDWKINLVTMITLPDGTMVPGDQVVLIAELNGIAGASVIESISEVMLVAMEVPSFTITGETIETAAPCPADFDHSGAVDVKDLLFLLGAWGPCPKQGDCPADFDNSGAVDVKDLLFLLGAWGPCP